MSQITQAMLWKLYIDSARHAIQKEQYEEAEDILVRSLEELDKLVETRKFLLIDVQLELANLYRQQRRFAEALPLYKWALAMADASGNGNADRASAILKEIGDLYMLQGISLDPGMIRERMKMDVEKLKLAGCRRRKDSPRIDGAASG